MAENKTVKTAESVDKFLSAVENKRRREDGLALLEMMKNVTGLEPEMWGPSIIGYGSYHYRYDSGREGDMPLTDSHRGVGACRCTSCPGSTTTKSCSASWASTAQERRAYTLTSWLTWTWTCSGSSDGCTVRGAYEGQ